MTKNNLCQVMKMILTELISGDCKNYGKSDGHAELWSRTKLQHMHRFLESTFFSPQISQRIMNKLTAHPIRTHSILGCTFRMSSDRDHS